MGEAERERLVALYEGEIAALRTELALHDAMGALMGGADPRDREAPGTTGPGPGAGGGWLAASNRGQVSYALRRRGSSGLQERHRPPPSTPWRSPLRTAPLLDSDVRHRPSSVPLWPEQAPRCPAHLRGHLRRLRRPGRPQAPAGAPCCP
jgi:hypothetical protein